MSVIHVPYAGQGLPKIDLNDPALVLYAPLYAANMVARGGNIVNGTGTLSASPINLAIGANTVSVTGLGTFIVSIPEGGTVESGTTTVTGSPVTVSAGIAATITTTGSTGTITVTPSNIIRSKDKNNLALTITGADWGSRGRTFTSTDNDYISITDPSALLNFTSGAFSIVIRCQISNASGGDQYFFTRGLANTDGYSFMMTSGSRLNFYTWQASAEQRTFTGTTSFVNGTNYTIGVSRSGTSGIIYKNGANVNDTGASHTNPLTSARTARIGVNDGLTAGWGALVTSVFVYNKSLSAAEHLSMHSKLSGNPL